MTLTGDEAGAALKASIVARSVDLEGFTIHRALPSAQARMVGPFVFLDHFGPTVFRAGAGMDVRPHPHIGLATLTYLFDGEVVHRDSLGTLCAIRPGEVNWMTAGRGIAHSERTAPERRTGHDPLHGLQCWVALPVQMEEMEPAFAHYASDQVAQTEAGGARARVVVGSAYGLTSPVATTSPTLFVDVAMRAGSQVPIDADHEERAVFVLSGQIALGNDTFGPERLLVLRPQDRLTLRALTDSRVMLLGGAPMDGPRHIWWNFVSSRKDRIESAKDDWRQGRFPSVAGDATEFVPLPQT